MDNTTNTAMNLSDAQRTQIALALRNKGLGQHGRCSLCNHNGWTLAAGFVMLSLQASPSAGLVIGGPSLPLVALTCDNCGHTLLVNIKVLGLGAVFGI
jgi:hypothetical protein